jgi:hypothetical protein
MTSSTAVRFVAAAVLALASTGSAAVAQSRPADRDEAPRADRSASTIAPDTRASLGLTVSVSGGDRDTLGLLISGVVADSPADRAGVADGNRLAAINGVSLRLSPDAVGDQSAEDALLRNLARELRNAQAGDELSLRVYSAGRFRNVTLEMPAAPRTRAIPSRTNNDDGDVTVPPTTISAVIDGLARLQSQLTHIAPSCNANGSSGDTISGLNLTTVSPELATYFGEGAENGLLVLKANENWSPLRAGDVVLRIDGLVATTSRIRNLADARSPSSVEVLRRKRVIEVSIGG